MSARPSDRAARALLVASALAGVGLAAAGLLDVGGPTAAPPADAIALVNGRAISREAFARFAGAVAAERRQLALDAAERRRLLERMIDEELLLQRGSALELHRHEPTARRAIVSALIASVTADAEVAEPGAGELRAFYAENRELFTRPGRVALDTALVAEGGAPDARLLERADEIARRLRAGGDLAAVRGALADPPVAELPAGLVSAETVRRYLGPTVARAVERLAPGEVSDPIRGSAGYWVVRLRERVAGRPAPFEEVRDQVRLELLRQRGDDALRAYLAELRGAADVRILDPELAGS